MVMVIEKRKFNGGNVGYDMKDVVAVMKNRLENDGFKVEITEKESPQSRYIGGDFPFVPHSVTILVRDEQLVPDIVEEEVEYIGDDRYHTMKNNLPLDTDGVYGIVLVGKRDTTNDNVMFVRVEKFLKNVVTIKKMGEGRTLEQSQLVEMKTRSNKFKDFRKFVNEKANNEYMAMLGLI